MKISSYFLAISGLSQTIPHNVAVGKSTTVQKASSAPAAARYTRWGNKNNLVDGSLSATLNSWLTECSGCFASVASEGYWQVNLGDKYFVPYIEIVRVNGKTNVCLCPELWQLLSTRSMV